MAKPDDNEPALPWALRPLPFGTYLEVEIEGAWVEVQVAEAHGEHQYTLVVLLHDDEDGAAAEQPQDGGAAGGAEGGAAAADAEGDELPALRVRLVSDSLLDVMDSDGSEPEGGSMRCHWRPAPANVSEMFSNAFLDLARSKPLPKGVELPSAGDMAALMTQKLAELVQRSVSHSAEAGSQVVEVGSVFAALAGMAADMGMPGMEERVRQQMQEQRQQQQREQQGQQGQQQQQQRDGEQQEQQQQQDGGAEEAEDGLPREKKARTSP